MLKKINKKRNQKGFTLVELIVVIAILGILAAITVPRLSGFRDSAEVAADKATAATIAKAAELYVAANGKAGYDALTKEEGGGIPLLVKEDLIDNNYEPQKSGKNFQLKWDDNQFKVYYDENGTPLYPTK